MRRWPGAARRLGLSPPAREGIGLAGETRAVRHPPPLQTHSYFKNEYEHYSLTRVYFPSWGHGRGVALTSTANGKVAINTLQE